MTYNNYLVSKKKANKLIDIISLFSIYNQKKIIKTIYKTKQKNKYYDDFNKVFESWMTIHNINY